MNIIRGIRCYLLGHRWRRPHKGEPIPLKYAPTDAMRFCARCGADRPAKSRRKKGQQA